MGLTCLPVVAVIQDNDGREEELTGVQGYDLWGVPVACHLSTPDTVL